MPTLPAPLEVPCADPANARAAADAVQALGCDHQGVKNGRFLVVPWGGDPRFVLDVADVVAPFADDEELGRWMASLLP